MSISSSSTAISSSCSLGKGCIPSPGVKLRFTRRERALDVVFFMECKMLFPYEGRRPIYGANIDVFLSIFPGDPGLLEVRDRWKP